MWLLDRHDRTREVCIHNADKASDRSKQYVQLERRWTAERWERTRRRVRCAHLVAMIERRRREAGRGRSDRQRLAPRARRTASEIPSYTRVGILRAMAGWNRGIRDEDCLNERGVRMSWYRDSSDGRTEMSECEGRARSHGFTDSRGTCMKSTRKLDSLCVFGSATTSR